MSAVMPDLTEYLEHFRARVVQDALAEATMYYWERRAAAFDWARPRATDWPGQATPEQLAEQDLRLAETALACRERAGVSLLGGAHA
jgi:hypothetical protein